MKELSSCKLAMENCTTQKYFAIAHLYKEEKAMNMHIHDCYEMYYSISGGKQFLIDHQCYTIQPGDLFVMNQYESHYLTQIDCAVHERIVIAIHPDFLKHLSSSQTNLAECFTNRPSGFSHRLSLTREQQNQFLYYTKKITTAEGYGEDLLEKATFIQLMLLLNAAYRSTTQSTPTLIPNKQVDEILAYINENIHEMLTIEDLASHFFISSSYLCRLFKAATGMTINKYMTARRMSIAKALLADGLMVNEVYLRCGYNDYSNFVKTFNRVVGMSPKKYAQVCVL